MTFQENELNNQNPSYMLDPVEHAVVEASWGEILSGDRSELVRGLGIATLHQLVERLPRDT